jgi:hypothetical protein
MSQSQASVRGFHAAAGAFKFWRIFRPGTAALPARGVRRAERQRCDGNRHDACPGVQPAVQSRAVAEPASE